MAPPLPSAVPVLVAGAGPTGLLLAVELRRRGVDCLVVDALDAPQPWDRATVVHSRSLEIFAALGLADRLLEAGIRTYGARIHAGGEVLGRWDPRGADTPYPFDIGVSEDVTERILAGHLEALGGAVTRSTRLAGGRAEDDRLVAVLERDGRTQEVAARWLVGCDGVHSAVREIAGIPFEGHDIDVPWAVFDAGVDGWDDPYDLVAPFLDTPTLILTPLPGRRWRAYVRPTSPTSDLVAEATGTLRRYKPDASFREVERATRFHCHSRVAARFRAGRILLAGDSAHACSPAEGHGMNTGLQDAYNLGWKLALVCQGAAGPALLDSYDLERRPVAVRVVAEGAGFEDGEGLSGAERATRDAQIRRTFSDPATAHHEAAATMEIDRSYAHSPVVIGEGAGRPAAGDRLPAALQGLVHRAGHTVLVLGGDEDAVAATVAAYEVAGAGSPVVEAVLGVPGDAPGADGPTVLGVRPDGYVGFRQTGGDPRVLTRYLRLLGAAAT